MITLSQKQFEKLSELFFILSGIHLESSKIKIVESRLMERLNQIGLGSFDEYLYVLGHFPEEIKHFLARLTTHHTFFFREPNAFDFVKNLLPQYFNSYNAGSVFKAWSAGCSTGEEAYSLAMVIDDFCQEKKTNGTFEILATDLDTESLQFAREALFAISALKNIPEKYHRYTEAQSDTFRISKGLSKHIQFVNHRLGVESHSDTFDLIFLRNVLLYFRPVDLNSIIQEMVTALKPNAILIVGNSDIAFQIPSTLEEVEYGVYRKKGQLGKILLGDFGKTKGEIDSGSKTSELPSARSGPKSKDKVRIILIDDSKTIHVLFRQILVEATDIELVAEAYNGREGLQLLLHHKVDLIVCDIHMPEMDGIAFLEAQMKEFRVPTLMLSSIQKEDAVQLLRAFEKGAVDYIEKPRNLDIRSIRNVILGKIRETACANVKTFDSLHSSPILNICIGRPNKKLILFGASTGGPDILIKILGQVPKDCPPIVIAQHMPAYFTEVFAARLLTRVAPSVKEAFHQDALVPGHIYIVPGGSHLAVRNSNGVLRAELNKEEKPFTPSVNHLFDSGALLTREFTVVGVVLTGMGNDGADGITRLHRAGGHTIAQNEKSCTMFGMPKAAIATGHIDKVCPASEIAKTIFDFFKLEMGENKIFKKAM